MKASILFVLACVLASCQLTNYVPPVTSQMATARTGQSVNLAMLHEGRTLFAHRCIECHTLPVVWQRASLKPAEREAIIAYIIAVRLAEH
jgi:hypothetical protein